MISANSANSAGSRGLFGQSLTALKWVYLGVAVRTASQLLIGIVLARLLGPEPFGVVAIAWLVINFCSLFSDFGFSAALVQRKEIETRDVRFVFSCQLLVGVSFTVFGVLLSPLIAEFFRSPSATDPLRAMFCFFILQALGQTSGAMLRRGLDFRALQQASIASYLIGYVALGIPGALLGYGVWALVAATLLQGLASSLWLIVAARQPLGFALRPSSRGLMGFGGRVMGANVANWTIGNIDGFVVGRMLGALELGLYNRAMTLVLAPMNAIASGMQSVLFSACSKVQHDPVRLRRAYLGAISAIGLVCMPVFFSAAAAAETVVLALYGAQWEAAVPLLVPLSLAMPANALLAMIGPVLMSMDRVGDEIRAQWLTVMLMVPVLVLTVQQGMVWIAWGVLLVYLFRWAILAATLHRAGVATLRDMGKALVCPLAIALAAAGCVSVAEHLMRWETLWPAPVRLALLVGVGAVASVIGLRVFGPALMGGELGALLRSRGPLPASFMRLFNLRS